MKSKLKQPTLFPGYLLSQKVRSFQQAACICGATFELITEKMLDAFHYQTDCTQALCPDLGWGNAYIESKCFGVNHRECRCLIEMKQLERYLQCGKSVWYCFWRYAKGFSVTRKKTTIGELVEASCLNVIDCILLDSSIVRAAALFIDRLPGISYRHAKLYFIGRGTITRDYLVLSRKFFDRLIEDPMGLLHALDLVYNTYEHSGRRRRITFKYDSVELKTNLFQFTSILPRVPF